MIRVARSGIPATAPTQLAKKGVALITQDDRVDSKIVWKLIAIKDFDPSLGSLQLCTKYAALLYFFVAYGVRLILWTNGFPEDR